MTRTSPLFLAVIMLCTTGFYGCTHQKNGAANAKMRDLETRFEKLEEDYRAVVATGEATRKKLVRSEAQAADLTREVEELRPVVQERDDLRKERDDLRKQVVARTGERDHFQTQLTQFRQDLQSLVSRVDTALNTPGKPGTPAGPVAAIPASRTSE